MSHDPRHGHAHGHKGLVPRHREGLRPPLCQNRLVFLAERLIHSTDGVDALLIADTAGKDKSQRHASKVPLPSRQASCHDAPLSHA